MYMLFNNQYNSQRNCPQGVYFKLVASFKGFELETQMTKCSKKQNLNGLGVILAVSPRRLTPILSGKATTFSPWAWPNDTRNPCWGRKECCESPLQPQALSLQGPSPALWRTKSREKTRILKMLAKRYTCPKDKDVMWEWGKVLANHGLSL